MERGKLKIDRRKPAEIEWWLTVKNKKGTFALHDTYDTEAEAVAAAQPFLDAGQDCIAEEVEI